MQYVLCCLSKGDVGRHWRALLGSICISVSSCLKFLYPVKAQGGRDIASREVGRDLGTLCVQMETPFWRWRRSELKVVLKTAKEMVLQKIKGHRHSFLPMSHHPRIHICIPHIHICVFNPKRKEGISYSNLN